MYKRILIPIDGSETSTKTLVAGLQMARDAGAQVRLVHAMDELVTLSGFESSGEVWRIWKDQATKLLDDAAAIAKAVGVTAEHALIEQPGKRLGEVIAQAASEWRADLVVVGTHGRRGLGRVLLGSGAEQIIRSAPVPVLVIRSEEAPSASAR